LKPTKFAVVVSIASSNKNIDHPGSASIGYVFDYGDNLDVASFASQLQGITNKSIKRFNSGLFELQLFPYLGPSVRAGAALLNGRERVSVETLQFWDAKILMESQNQMLSYKRQLFALKISLLNVSFGSDRPPGITSELSSYIQRVT